MGQIGPPPTLSRPDGLPMRTVTLLAVSLSLAFALACSGLVPPTDEGQTSSPDGTTPDEVEPTEVATPAPTSLPEPWASMMLPVGDGEIIEASAESALVSYPTSSLLTLTNTWTGALTNAGYAQVEDVSKPGITALIFRKANNQVGLVTGQEEGVNFAYVEDLGKVKTSMVRGQRKAGLRHGRRTGPGLGLRRSGEAR